MKPSAFQIILLSLISILGMAALSSCSTSSEEEIDLSGLEDTPAEDENVNSDDFESSNFDAADENEDSAESPVDEEALTLENSGEESDESGSTFSEFEEGSGEPEFTSEDPSFEDEGTADSDSMEESPFSASEDPQSPDEIDPFSVSSETESEETSGLTLPKESEDPFARFDGIVEESEPSDPLAVPEMESTPESAMATESNTFFEEKGSQEAVSEPFMAEPAADTQMAPESEFGSTTTITYLVAPGDTLYEIASRIYGRASDWKSIAARNNLPTPFLIYPGDELQIDAFGSANQYAEAYANTPDTVVTVKRGDTLSSIAQSYLGDAGSWKYIWKSNQDTIRNPNLLQPGQVLRFKDYRAAHASL